MSEFADPQSSFLDPSNFALPAKGPDSAMVEERLGYKFRNPALLLVATSRDTEVDAAISTRDRVELIGKQLVRLAVAELVAAVTPPVAHSRALHKQITDLTSAQSLCDLAGRSGLRNFLQEETGFLGGQLHGAKATAAERITASNVCALVGAVMVDSDWATAQRVVTQLYQANLVKQSPGEEGSIFVPTTNLRGESRTNSVVERLFQHSFADSRWLSMALASLDPRDPSSAKAANVVHKLSTIGQAAVALLLTVEDLSATGHQSPEAFAAGVEKKMTSLGFMPQHKIAEFRTQLRLGDVEGFCNGVGGYKQRLFAVLGALSKDGGSEKFGEIVSAAYLLSGAKASSLSGPVEQVDDPVATLRRECSARRIGRPKFEVRVSHGGGSHYSTVRIGNKKVGTGVGSTEDGANAAAALAALKALDEQSS